MQTSKTEMHWSKSESSIMAKGRFRGLGFRGLGVLGFRKRLNSRMVKSNRISMSSVEASAHLWCLFTANMEARPVGGSESGSA